MRRGIVRWFNLARNYGFIHTERGDIFLHGSDWLNPNRLPQKSELVQFEVDQSEKGLKAIKADRVNN